MTNRATATATRVAVNEEGKGGNVMVTAQGWWASNGNRGWWSSNGNKGGR